MAVLMKGAEAAAGMKEALLAELAAIRGRGIEPKLAVVRVGARDDDLAYERGIRKRFEGLGMAVRVIVLPEDIGQDAFDAEFAWVNGDPQTHGVLLFRPLPGGLSDANARRIIDPRKDVDGMSPINMARVFAGEAEGFAPCTPGAVMELLRHYGVSLEGKSVAVAGRSMVAGRPLAMLMLAANATVTLCHTRTRDLSAVCRSADIVVAAAGRAGMIGADCVTERSVIVDVGINMGRDGKLCGDVDFGEASPLVSMITPVPGGVGALTTSVLARNLLRAARLQI
ncbi:MAG: bifunctional 5,10-methylenetetrahydrofolate dehydrogenase/5,10-methenyltetrahydrofolate cyclohydrolase [Fretibacterium sp.]|nr:bifunctional 5,10-methylenetetrahydrofolate dehydrogenase/5,10-methenyltetrahydrofolate cyclohydrolase [Fretibacterium sp.]